MLKKRVLRTRALFLATVFLLVSLLGSVCVSASTAHTGMRNITSLELVNEMKVGWNLGNTLDSHANDGSVLPEANTLSSETSWGNPVTTKAMIDKIKEQGFNTVRIPVTWYQHLGPAPDYTIHKAWLDRVEEIVNYVLDNNMYVILNLHHEESWLIPTYANQSKSTAELTKIWEQIANRFKNYSDYLVFEVMNEPRVVGSSSEWSGGTPEYRDVINKYNLAAVNTIRGTGGNNAVRHIMIPTHGAAALDVTINDLVIPNNDSRVIVSLHMYSPYYFSMDINGTSSWGSDSDKASLVAEMDKVYNKFVKNGRAVVLGEFGSINKDNEASRVAHAEYYVKTVRARGITPIWWDNGYYDVKKSDTYELFNRRTLTWVCPTIANALTGSISTPTPTPTGTLTPTPTVTPTPTPTGTPTPTPTGTLTPTPTPLPKACSVSYKVQNSWNTGATVNVEIKNNSGTAINGWTLNWTFPDSQKIDNLWNGVCTQNGASVSVKDAGYNSSIPANETVSLGFNISYTGSNTSPTVFTLNGSPCETK